MSRPFIAGPRRRARLGHRGFSLIEVLVALACTGLLTAGVLGLMVDGVGTYGSRQSRLHAEAGVRAARRALGEALAGAGRGLEGARAIRIDGERFPVVELSAATLRVVLPAGDPREADTEPDGWLRLGSVSGLEAGDLVVGVGVGAGAVVPAELPAGPIVEIVRDRARGPSGGTVRVGWAAGEAEMVAAGGRPRALLPVDVREFGLRSAGRGLELRRRDRGGRWQPIVDGLDTVGLATLAPAGATAPPSGALVELTASATASGGAVIVARTRVRLR